MQTTPNGTASRNGDGNGTAPTMPLATPAATPSAHAEPTADGKGFRLNLRVGGLELEVTVRSLDDEPVVEANPPRTPAERDVLALLGNHRGERLTTSRVLERLERHGFRHGEATVKRALARLVKEGVVLASRKAPRGYCLASRGGGPARP